MFSANLKLQNSKTEHKIDDRLYAKQKSAKLLGNFKHSEPNFKLSKLKLVNFKRSELKLVNFKLSASF